MPFPHDFTDSLDHEFEAMLSQHEAEMDQDPSQVISHQEFLAHFSDRRQA